MQMTRYLILFAALASASPAAAQGTDIVARYRAAADSLIGAATRDTAAFARLGYLVDTFGPRFSGTPALERAIDWTLAEMRRDGLDSVRGEPVMVPRWVRGAESLVMTAPHRKSMQILGLGGSVGTPARGITAPVLVVGSFEELDQRAAEARGKIVVFDVPFTTYGQTVRYRGAGASRAAQHGAVAALVRSVTPHSLNTPHTGGMRYDTTVSRRRIPTAAITVEDAMMLARMQARGQKPMLTLRMAARTLPDAPSRNVVAEIRGTERPDEIVVLGGHIDSWDVGQGAMDDAGGVVAAWEAVRLMKQLGLRPRRTVRVVGWTNEENGLAGGNAYRDRHRAQLDRHVLAIESDAGVFKPLGFGFTGSDSARAIVSRVAQLLERIGAGQIGATGGGADIGPIMALGVPGMGLNVEPSKYFWYHHTDADTMDKLNRDEFNLCVAVMAVMAYVIADLPETLPRQASAGGASR